MGSHKAKSVDGKDGGGEGQMRLRAGLGRFAPRWNIRKRTKNKRKSNMLKTQSNRSLISFFSTESGDQSRLARERSKSSLAPKLIFPSFDNSTLSYLPVNSGRLAAILRTHSQPIPPFTTLSNTMVRPTAEQTRVTFVVVCETQFGQRLRIAGNDPVLGGWDPYRALELTTSQGDFPRWRVSVTLPANKKICYKYVVVSKPSFMDAGSDKHIQLTPQADALTNNWETFDAHREFNTLSGATMVINDGDFDTYNGDMADRVQTTSLFNSHPSLEKDLEHEDGSSIRGPSIAGQQVIIVLYRLPLIAKRKTDGSWDFEWDDDALYLTSTGLRRGLDVLKAKVLWVGIIPGVDHVDESEHDAISDRLLREFSCVPVFIEKDILTKFYQGFCKGFLWPSFHMLTTVHGSDGRTVRFDNDSWHAYQRVNRMFSKAVVSKYDNQLIWVHDYHLMLLPYYLRVKLSGVKIGFYLHIPWPSSEIFRMLPVRNEILKGLLSSTLLGFHLFDYARHFLSACVRLLNLEHEARRGSLGIEYEGRHVNIRVSHIGVDPERFQARMTSKTLHIKVAELKAKYPSTTLLGAIDDLDVVKGIALKLIAFENYLAGSSDKVRSNVALIQVAIPKTARVDAAVRDEIRELVSNINSKYGKADHQPVLYIEECISFDERMAIYKVCDALLLTPIRDGLNLIPYEYIISTIQGKGQLILSEFTGCSRALSSAVRVNPWNINELRDAIDNVVQRRESRAAEIRLRHEADRKYVTHHSSSTWAESFLGDLNESSEAVQQVVRLGLGVGLGVRRLEFEDFTMLNSRNVVRAFREAKNKLFLFDYDGTLTQIASQSSRMAHAWARPSDETMMNLEALSKQDNCTVIILSGRKKETEGFLVERMHNIGIAAEHGFHYKEPGSKEFVQTCPDADLTWMDVVSRIMTCYTERTDGSYIEHKTAGVVWHYHDADPEFGSWQSKEMHEHLESILAPFNVQVLNGQGWLQVRLNNINKGIMVKDILNNMDETPDFVLCCGDDRTDEDMFSELVKHTGTKDSKLFTTTVGVKPSNARYYLRSSLDVSHLIEQIMEVAFPGSATHVRSSTLEDFRPETLANIADSSGDLAALLKNS